MEGLKTQEAEAAKAWVTRVVPVQEAVDGYRAAVRAQLIAFRTGADDKVRDKAATTVRLALGTLNRAIDHELQAETGK